MSITNKTYETMTNVAVKKENGRVLFYQCRPVLKTETVVSYNNRNQPTLNDQLMQIQQSLRLIRITRGK
jgi:hypothetical protein